MTNAARASTRATDATPVADATSGRTVSPIARTQIGSLLLGVVAACVLWALGRTLWVWPLLGGVVWGVVNVSLILQLTDHIRPDRPTRTGSLLVGVLLKGPAMYAIAFVLLRSRSREEILAAGAGFGLVLLVMLLRAVGLLLTGGLVRRDPGQPGAGAHPTEGESRATVL